MLISRYAYLLIVACCVDLSSCNSTAKLNIKMQPNNMVQQHNMVQQPNCTLIHAYNANTVPHPLGPYSTIVRVDNSLYLSGVVAVDPKTEKLMVGGVEAETRKAMIYVKRILEEAGSSLERIALVRLYVTHIGDAEKINNVYEEFVSAPFPARVMVEVRSLPLGAHIEIEVMALISATCRL